MRRLFFVLFSVCVGLAIACGARRAPEKFQQKLVILGFDGLDPRLVRKWMDEGKLPNMQKIAKQGGLHHLETTHSPESPTAWASFATGVNAGGHREILGLQVTSAEDGAGWLASFRDLTARGLTGVQLVTSDAHRGLVDAIGATLPGAAWQRCRTRAACVRAC